MYTVLWCMHLGHGALGRKEPKLVYALWACKPVMWESTEAFDKSFLSHSHVNANYM